MMHCSLSKLLICPSLLSYWDTGRLCWLLLCQRGLHGWWWGRLLFHC